MSNRTQGFAALLAVIGMSIVFGMVLGGRLNAPRTVLAAPETALPASAPPAVRLAPVNPAASLGSFADIVEQSLPSVVGVTNTQASVQREEGDEEDQRRRNDFFRWFLGEPEDQPQRRFEIPQQGFGSGFVISADGYILTNDHVVADSDRIMVGLYDGGQVEARLIGRDQLIDLALLKIDPGERTLRPLPLGDSDGLRVGEWVIAIGNPFEFQQSVTVGVVSAKERRVPIGTTDSNVAHFIQTDAAINFGNSGGPLLDAAGNVIGINTAIRRGNMAEGIGFALPVNEIKNALDQLLSSGRVSRGFLGISLNPQGLSEASAEYYGLPDTNGVIVLEVNEGLPAATAGVKRNDVIRKVDGELIRDNLDLIRKISKRRPGDDVKLEIFRDGQTMVRTARLADREEALAASGVRQESPREPLEPETTEEARGLGLTVESLSPTLRRDLRLDEGLDGVVVSDVEFGSAAQDAGILPSAVIRSINDIDVKSASEWARIVSALAPGSPVKLELLDPRSNASRYVFMRTPER